MEYFNRTDLVFFGRRKEAVYEAIRKEAEALNAPLAAAAADPVLVTEVGETQSNISCPKEQKAQEELDESPRIDSVDVKKEGAVAEKLPSPSGKERPLIN